MLACAATLCWTIQAYYYKKLITSQRFSSTDLAFDGLSISYTIGLIILVSYLIGHDFNLKLLLYGSSAGFLIVTGNIFMLVSYETGPGGPVQAMVILQSLWQILFDALFLG